MIHISLGHFERDESYIGACETNHFLGNRVSQLIALADSELKEQRDHFGHVVAVHIL